MNLWIKLNACDTVIVACCTWIEFCTLFLQYNNECLHIWLFISNLDNIVI